MTDIYSPQKSDDIEINIKDIEKSWDELKLLVEKSSALELIYAHDELINTISKFSQNLSTCVDRAFPSEIMRSFVNHEINNKLGFFVSKLRDQEYYETRPEKRSSYELAIDEGKAHFLLCVPLILKIIYTEDFKSFTIKDLITFTGLENLEITLEGDINAKIKTQHSFILIVLLISELFNNMSKNGGKKFESAIHILLDKQNFKISVKDKGKGLDSRRLFYIRKSLKPNKSNTLLNPQGNRGFGLKSIVRLGIGVQIDSEGLGMGSTVTLSIPIEQTEG